MARDKQRNIRHFDPADFSTDSMIVADGGVFAEKTPVEVRSILSLPRTYYMQISNETGAYLKYREMANTLGYDPAWAYTEVAEGVNAITFPMESGTTYANTSIRVTNIVGESSDVTTVTGAVVLESFYLLAYDSDGNLVNLTDGEGLGKGNVITIEIMVFDNDTTLITPSS